MVRFKAAGTEEESHSTNSQWLSIPWQPDLGTGIMMANEQDKPVALWTECGHPLAEV
jgi:hypothetical protein